MPPGLFLNPPQHFLGLANFYRQFILNYSSVATPFTTLTSSKTPYH